MVKKVDAVQAIYILKKQIPTAILKIKKWQVAQLSDANEIISGITTTNQTNNNDERTVKSKIN